MDENDKFKITIRVADIPEFKITIRRVEEEFYRQAAEGINKLWSKWKTMVIDNDSQSVLALIAVRFAMQFYKTLDQFKKAEELDVAAKEEVSVLLEDFEKELDKILLDVK